MNIKSNGISSGHWSAQTDLLFFPKDPVVAPLPPLGLLNWDPEREQMVKLAISICSFAQPSNNSIVKGPGLLPCNNTSFPARLPKMA